MGYNTTLLLLNDGLGAIEDDLPGWFARVRDAIPGYGSAGTQVIGAGNHGNPSTVVTVAHADVHSLIAVGGNYATVLGQYFRGNVGHHMLKDQIELLRLAARGREHCLVPRKLAELLVDDIAFLLNKAGPGSYRAAGDSAELREVLSMSR